MELVYLCNTVSFDREIEINFSEEFHLEIRNLTLVISPKTDRIEDFFGKRISNVTAFIGRNGTGKTTNICNQIMSPNWLSYRFLVFKTTEGTLKVFRNPKNIYGVKNDSSVKHELITILDSEPGQDENVIHDKTNEELKQVFHLYYSTSFTDPSIIPRSFKSDISTSGLIKHEQSKKEREYDDAITAFRYNELRKQLGFYNSDIGKQFMNVLTINPMIIVRVNSNEVVGSIEKRLISINIFKELKSKWDSLGVYGVVDVTQFPGAVRSVIILWAIVSKLGDSFRNEFIEFLEKKNFNFYADEITIDDDFLNLNTSLGALIEIINDNILSIQDHYMSTIANSFSLAIQNTSYKIPLEIASRFIELLKNKLGQKINEYEFQWNISSGEYSFLSLFSRLFENDYRYDKRHLILVIDEGDTNFHPEWSRQYVSILTNWLPKILIKAESIQVILTTHSPYVLSDLPSNNVYTIKKEKGEIVIKNTSKSTFGANVNELLADSFFLEGSLIGEFAKEKIQTVIDNLRVDDFTPDTIIDSGKIKKTIKLIGEPFLRRKLTEMYYTKYSEEYNLEREISDVAKRLEHLKKIQNDRDSSK